MHQTTLFILLLPHIYPLSTLPAPHIHLLLLPFTLQLCKTQGSSCVGVDYNGAAGTCLVLTAAEVCATFIPNSDVIHISRFDCGE